MIEALHLINLVAHLPLFVGFFGFIGLIIWGATLKSDCPKCGERAVSYAGDDWTGRVWISVSQCGNCKSQFV